MQRRDISRRHTVLHIHHAHHSQNIRVTGSSTNTVDARIKQAWAQMHARLRLLGESCSTVEITWAPAGLHKSVPAYDWVHGNDGHENVGMALTSHGTGVNSAIIGPSDACHGHRLGHHRLERRMRRVIPVPRTPRFTPTLLDPILQGQPECRGLPDRRTSQSSYTKHAAHITCDILVTPGSSCEPHITCEPDPGGACGTLDCPLPLLLLLIPLLVLQYLAALGRAKHYNMSHIVGLCKYVAYV
eukprot:364696-Chlamydomonas_euryale.AAC.1